MNIKVGLVFLFWVVGWSANAQQFSINGIVLGNYQQPLSQTIVSLANNKVVTNAKGEFNFTQMHSGKQQITITHIGYLPLKKWINSSNSITQTFQLTPQSDSLQDVVVTGTLSAINKAASPVTVEIVSSKLFKKLAAPNLFEAVGMLNGIQPQINCGVCNSGDIHINGMEGPYTMVLIDGMPIVSGLATVYGFSGIPNSIIDKVEVVKGPASSLYGSNAMAGIINIITKNASKMPLFSGEIIGSSIAEFSGDFSYKLQGKKASSLIGVSLFNFNNIVDKNDDGFTDMALQKRYSLFTKTNFIRKNNYVASIAARLVYEDRWGGQTQWQPKFAGTDSVYGETIKTKRLELFGTYQLPIKPTIITQVSYNAHLQDSWYGVMPYWGNQHILFAQTFWQNNHSKKQQWLVGSSVKYNYYDDNSVATQSVNGNENLPAKTTDLGLFSQLQLNYPKTTFLVGYRADYNTIHGLIHSPRIAIKQKINNRTSLRLNAGTGFRVVNLFTEEHAALTGAREIVIANNLNPERSFSITANIDNKTTSSFANISSDVSVFYTHFSNKIFANYDIDPNKIVYDNLQGYAISKGISANTELQFFAIPLKVMAGVSYMDVFQVNNENGNKIKQQQVHAPKWSGNFVATYTFNSNFLVDVTAKWFGPMRLPIVANDFRDEYSPFYSILNIQATYSTKKKIEWFAGIKNLLNFLPQNPILRPFDPFDKRVNDPINNPNNYTFDASYNYAPMQPMRFYAGCRFSIL